MKRIMKKWVGAMMALCMMITLITVGKTTVKAETAFTLSNPRIVEDSSMQAGQKVTWDCIYFGSYPQREVTSTDSEYTTLQNATGWDDNGDIVIGENKYRRICQVDTFFKSWAPPVESTVFYQWERGELYNYHYFKYEPIKWCVLNTNGKEALLLSDVVLDAQIYNSEAFDITWENSTIRSWLNGYAGEENYEEEDYSKKNFAASAFGISEKNAINNTNVLNNDNITYGTSGGNETTDKIFLLSESEVHTELAKEYGFIIDCEIDDDEIRHDEGKRCKSSDYAKARGVCSDHSTRWKGNSRWWLRTPGKYSDEATYITASGFFEYGGTGVENYEFGAGVRPALYLDLSYANLWSYAGTVCSDEAKDIIVEEQTTNNQETINGGIENQTAENISIEGGTKVQISPKVTALATVKIKKATKGKKKASLTLKKVSGAKGYLIQYGTKKTFKGAKSKYTIKTKLTIKKLKSKKTYYFRAKAYKLDGKKRVLSAKWSNVKKVKVK